MVGLLWKGPTPIRYRSMIKDSNGDELTYWPISGLVEGENSEVLDFTLEIPDVAATLTANADARLIVWAKKVGDASFVNISEDPYDLSSLSGDVDFQAYVEALSPIEGLERVPVSVIAGTGSAAGWAT